MSTTTAETYRAERLVQVNSEANPYPHKFHVSIQFSDYIHTYKDTVNAGEQREDIQVSLAGRVQEKRCASKKLYFYTVTSNGQTLQYMVNKALYGDPEAFNTDNQRIHRGDIVGIRGFVGKSKAGELSVFARELVLLTPCLHILPKLVYGITDPGLRAQKRYLDLIANLDSRTPFVVRSKVLRTIREYLHANSFVEVHTPVLSAQAGGAAARPFITHHNDLNRSMHLRIAPELFLKQLVVGGLDRVYELGPQFRNEGVDGTHNPEFYSLEFYMAYADYNDLMIMAEELLASIGKVCNSEIFTPPFRRIDMISELERLTGIAFPTDLNSDQAREFLDQLCVRVGVECPQPRTTARLLDKLAGHYIEPQCQRPTFIINHPQVMSPLAKYHRDNHQLTERFELFVNGMEICNAYTELNNPMVQRERFEQQMRDKASGDQEAQPIDEGFIDALEYGLPPTGGFGMGIDRLIMLLCGRDTIRDVITFPVV